MDLVSAELPARTLVVAIDPGKAKHRVLLADGERGLPVTRCPAPPSIPSKRRDRLPAALLCAAGDCLRG
jgi:hypothetical protein